MIMCCTTPTTSITATMASVKRDHKMTQEVQASRTMALSLSPRPMKRRRVSDSAESSSPSQDTNNKKKRSVHFAETAEVRVLPKQEQEGESSQPKFKSWYTPIDISLFKLQEGTDAAVLRCIISQASSIEHLPQDAAVYRGLERLLSPQIVFEIRGRRKLVVKAVLTEQACLRQRRLGGDMSVKENEEVLRLAQVSRCCTEKASVWARTLGSLV